MTEYIASVPAVKVAIGAVDGNKVAHIVRLGSPVPEGVGQEQLDSLVRRGLIKVVEPVVEVKQKPARSTSTVQ
ncbi:hypothetical protein [Curtobacterium flaccumfaciens]|uniref:hypothetical protein n=1 Tax=Curtobacterium flaccumfaciens TaxID=2035 RepID=UPI001AD971EE|nr:hypothetical protein [Curtobacterium flaccumfaciens]MBO9043470.1 hypothetical protein [Curtobacterium flaccumfaciens pv. flaccumfaciens]